MSVFKILNENWDDYDNKKIMDRRDSAFFACTEEWEVNYLVDKIRKHFPSHSKETIRIAIKSCCNTISSPHPRPKFVECVVSKL